MTRPLRSHQRTVANVMRAVGRGETSIRDVLAAVTPGGGKSLLPVLAAAELKAAGAIDRVCWIVPRDSLRLQAEEAFADPVWRQALGHGMALRAAENAPDLCRGLDGYVTTYQSIAAAPDLHLAEISAHRYLVAVDELHHLPALSDTDRLASAGDETAWSRSILPLLECAAVRLLMSGTLERADGKGILWLPYRKGKAKAKVRNVDLEAENWAVVGYSRRRALEERAILPVTFGALDGAAEWMDTGGQRQEVRSFNEDYGRMRDALFTALRTEYADDLLRRAFDDCRRRRAERRAELGVGPGEAVRGLGKLLVVAPDQTAARRYMETLAPRVRNGGDGEASVRLAISDAADAQEAIAAFRLRPFPSILVTVAMAYEGMDCPEISHVACLTHIRSRPWLEQMIARATRVDPHGGPYDRQRAVVYHPDDPQFREFRHAIETEQGTAASIRKRRRQAELPFDVGGDDEPKITPLHSNATALRFDVVAPGPDLRTAADPLAHERFDLFEPPSVVEHRTRQRIGLLVSNQVIEDGADRGPRGSGYHAYNAALKRVFGKSRAEMSLEEMEAAVAWLERNRLSDHLHLLAEDQQYRWSAARKQTTLRLGPHRVEIPGRRGGRADPPSAADDC